ncbi:cytochrome bc1 complex Rieske iron-sulfur subunit [Pseudonocardia oceani]|nr:ubiquinol-cytochrome c reductase iron-sulfur subunit [Pseudonocardia oceani]
MSAPDGGRPDRRTLRRMTREQLTELGGRLDGVRVVARTPTSARTRARGRRATAAWLALSILSALAFLVCFVAWPSDYVLPGREGYTLYALYTPVIGITAGVAVLALGIALIVHVKHSYPDEVAVQELDGGPSEPVDRATAAARFAEAGDDTGFGREPLLRRAVIGAAGLLGISGLVVAAGGLVRDPWKGGDRAALWTTGWAPLSGETVYLRLITGVLGEIVRVRPEDMAPGSMLTVVPFRESDRGNPELLLAAERSTDSPVMLIRFRPGTAVVPRAGQEDFHYGDHYAYSKLCTHLGCPASLYDTQNNRALCPCHQSAFAMDEGARPVFGPAARSLPQLPIDIDDEGYLVATGDFVEPVGPSFWELGSRG